MKSDQSSTSRVAVVGSINIDVISCVDSFPIVGETALANEAFLSLGGKGLNQAVAASRAGAEVALIASIGKDVFGQQALEHLTREKIDSSGVLQTLEKPTGTANILVDTAGDNMIAVAAGANSLLTPSHVQKNATLIQKADVLLLQMEVPIEANICAAEIAVKAGKIVVLDPSPYQASAAFGELLSSVNILTPNETEAAQLCGQPDTEFSNLFDLLNERGVPECVLTRGARGCVARLAGEDFTVGGLKVKAVDPTGAGDVFNGYLAKCIASGMAAEKALERASWAGALSTKTRGAQGAAPYWANIDKHIEGGKRAIQR